MQFHSDPVTIEDSSSDSDSNITGNKRKSRSIMVFDDKPTMDIVTLAQKRIWKHTTFVDSFPEPTKFDDICKIVWNKAQADANRQSELTKEVMRAVYFPVIFTTSPANWN